jgi:riboflavin biosynthesis pyrimidine reductase
METPVKRLLPGPVEDEPLEGCYLQHRLHIAGSPQVPFVYTNFIQTLDGRVALRNPETGRLDVPSAAANARDWRLFQELAAQADVLLTTGRHLRALAAGRQTDLLELPEDLRQWRRDQGLQERPAVAAVTTGGRWLEEPGLAGRLLQALPEAPWLILPRDAPPGPTAKLEQGGIPLVRVPEASHVPGESLIRGLAEHGFTSIYSIAGPRVFHALADGGLLDRLYLTQVQVMVGGDEYETLAQGPPFRPALGLRLAELRIDPGTPGGAGQMFQVLKRL